MERNTDRTGTSETPMKGVNLKPQRRLKRGEKIGIWAGVGVVILVVVVVVGVMVGNAINGANAPKTEEVAETAEQKTDEEILLEKYEECMNGEGPFDQIECFEEFYKEDDPDIMYEMFKMAISEYEDDGDYTGAMQFLIQRSVFAALQGDCATAEKFYDEFDPEGYSGMNLVSIYQSAANLAGECYNYEAQETWQAKSDNISEEVRDAFYD